MYLAFRGWEWSALTTESRLQEGGGRIYGSVILVGLRGWGGRGESAEDPLQNIQH